MNALALQFVGQEVTQRAVIYARAPRALAGDTQRQQCLLREYANRHGYYVVAVVVEHAGDTEDRPELENAIKLLEQHQADVILAEFPERLVRGIGWAFLQRYVQSLGGSVVTAVQ